MIVNAANGKKEEKRTYLLCMLRHIFPWSGEDNEASFDAYWTTVGVGCVIVVSVRGWKLLDEVGCWGRHWTWWPLSMVVGAGCRLSSSALEERVPWRLTVGSAIVIIDDRDVLRLAVVVVSVHHAGLGGAYRRWQTKGK